VSSKRARFIDANVIIRFLTHDEPAQAARCDALFQRVSAKRETVELSEIVVADVVWTLHSHYRLAKEQIREYVSTLLIQPAVELPDKTRILEALSLFANENVDFSDALIATRLKSRGIEEIYSYDRDFDRMPGIKRVEP
jgi:predicted nucleic-acid-binding protein